jgi:hypothetical protein
MLFGNPSLYISIESTLTKFVAFSIGTFLNKGYGLANIYGLPSMSFSLTI